MSTALDARPSTMCRRDEHAMCSAAGAKCGCECHGRNGQEARKPPARREDKPMEAARTLKSVPMAQASIGLVRAEPPARSIEGRQPLTAKLTEHVEKVRAEPGTWFQIAEFRGKSSAGGHVKKCRIAFPDCEWRGCTVGGGGSALFVRANA